MRYRLERVEFMPSKLEPGILYVSEEFETAAHLCACGCNSKVRTPLGPAEWSFTDSPTGPSLRPSIGNWQLPCRSHYCIMAGEVEWADSWSEEQVVAGRRREQRAREAYYARLAKPGILTRVWVWIKSLFSS